MAARSDQTLPADPESLAAPVNGATLNATASRAAARARRTSRQQATRASKREAKRAAKRGSKRDGRGEAERSEERDVKGADERAAQSSEPLSGKEYARAMKKLHVELVRLQEWVRHEGLKVCVVFEGRDGAGKGGTIKAITERVSPRIFRVIALPAPTEREKSQMYVQRYLPHLPAAGEIVIFDRSWYNRAGVERVMGFCTEDQARTFLEAIPSVERAMVDSGIILLKYWLEVSPEEQTRRLSSRIKDGRKIWKLSPMDLKSYSRWFDYSRARDEMFQASDTPWAPWFVVPSDDKQRARLNCISHLLGSIDYKSVPREKIELPKRQKAHGYKDPHYPFKLVPQQY
jgi:polyphosphate kinase